MGGGYTLSITILHYYYRKRLGSFLGVSECHGFLEVLYSYHKETSKHPVDVRIRLPNTRSASANCSSFFIP